MINPIGFNQKRSWENFLLLFSSLGIRNFRQFFYPVDNECLLFRLVSLPSL